MCKYKIIIPAYNEGKSIRRVLEKIPSNFDCIVVDDGSSDDTANEVLKTRAKLLKNVCNIGQGGAIETGIKYALLDQEAGFFATFDADGQHKVEDLLGMFAKIEVGGNNILMGSRFLKDQSNIPPLKRATLHLALLFTKISTGLNITDVHNGLRVFDRNFAEKIRFNNFGMTHASDIYGIIKDNSFSYGEYPTTIVYSDYSKAKGQPIINSVNILFDMLFERKK